MSDQLNSGRHASLRRLALAAAVIVATVSQTTAGFAVGTARQRAACTGDVLRLCFTSIGSDRAIIACMTANKDRLSKRCKATLPPI
ncbi:MAG: hypothetical protein M5U07_16880 [Xanthobacteraceae bacterium]|nr:hypothetical protein [Xanthobacteraceae bacterium]